MKRYLGIITDINDLESYKESLRNFAARVNKEIDVIFLKETKLIAEFIKENHEKYCRVIFYDYEEFNNIKQLQNVFRLCQHYNLELSIIKQDIHSDVAVELSYLLQVI
ncbi:hypothetical protein RRV45_01135 [Bacillus sp. DTU_2020_1000418_1_SI_GHA_SEK_038]|uniref:hypothetical protein n=1 Tax=Bacillus sp. DTU_2020_1000418_1_SI_GHA_SEK_038 TaxID=3077585 RepID=UPI0028F00431|nr:hypothetical protein [Bacillus sp. DTU_2020_1000418_1_SI_GHA_SEK_038]WNS75683.1 hypothetical protein RRV45_01135 [Bacillus sp. DTU_2020_1000418_1_SI_GHA_SEK_038]